jgi:hypothetical protein
VFCLNINKTFTHKQVNTALSAALSLLLGLNVCWRNSEKRGKNCPRRGNTYKIQLLLQKGALGSKAENGEKPLKKQDSNVNSIER